MAAIPERFTWSIFLGVACFVVLLFLMVGKGEASELSSSVSQEEFDVDNSDGLISARFEPTLIVENDGDSPMNVTISLTIPDGEDTGLTKDVFPHIYTDSSRRKDKGMTHYTEIEPEDTRFYLAIDVNDSALADTYTFMISVESEDNSDRADPIEITVEVTPYNDITIEFPSGEEREKMVTAGRATIVSILLKNRGNIYEEVVDVEVTGDDGNELPPNLTLIEKQFPGTRDFINPEAFGSDIDIIIGIKFEADAMSGPGTFDIRLYVSTPMNEEPVDGHRYVSATITIKRSPGEDGSDGEDDDDDDLQVSVPVSESESEELNLDMLVLEIVEILVIFTLVLWWRNRQ